MRLDRRQVLKSGLIAGSATIGLQGLLARTTVAGEALRRNAANERGGYGALAPRLSRNTGESLLALPEGFEYTVFGKEGGRMTDGRITPAMHDGMAAFQIDGKVRLVRNHEVRNRPADGACIGPREESYDPYGGGGTTTIEVDPETRLPLRDWVSVSGTIVNCAGGPTPWGTWITCEETTAGRVAGQVYHKDETVASYAADHGYNFEVDATSDGITRAVPLKEMGRFVHEAVAIDPSTGIVYQTEDTRTAGFYRFIPNVPGQLARGGRLEMMAIRGGPELDTRVGQRNGITYECHWVPIADPDPTDAATKPLAVFEQGKAQGAATFGRLEGCWYGHGCIYLNSTDGGEKKKGQVWRYRPLGLDRGELTLIFESPGAEVLDMPDNLCVSPRGGLVLCEDGKGEQFVRGLTPEGLLFDFATNLVSEGELAGATFSPDGKTLFFNIQSPGLTFAVWGPWERGAF